MHVRATLWYESPGTIALEDDYPSIAAVRREFDEMVASYRRYGGAKPTGVIYPFASDEPIYILELTRRDTAKQTRA